MKAHKGTSSYSLPQAVFLCKQPAPPGRCPDRRFPCELWPCGFYQSFKEKSYRAPISTAFALLLSSLVASSILFFPLSSFLRGYFRWEKCRPGLPVVRGFDSVWRCYNAVICCWMLGNGVERPLSVFHMQNISTRSYSDVLWALTQVTHLNVSRLGECELVLGTKL